MRLMARFRRYQGWIEKIMGALLVLTGILIMTGGLNYIGNWLLMTFPETFGSVG